MAHLIADTISAPAKRQFAQISGADDETVTLVGETEQVVGAQTGLHIFERDVVHWIAVREGVVHVAEHLFRRRSDIDLGTVNPERVHQRPGIGSGVLARRETGHGVAKNGRARQAEQVAGLGGDDQRMGGIQSARNADDHMLAAGCFEPAGKTVDLNVERLIAVLRQPLGAVRHIGKTSLVAAEADVIKLERVIEGDPTEAAFGVSCRCGCIVERANPHPFEPEPLHIDIGDDLLRLAREAGG